MNTKMKSITIHLDNVDNMYLNSSGNVANCATCTINNTRYINSITADIALFLISCDKNTNKTHFNLDFPDSIAIVNMNK